jgi:hypothetical protein
VYSLPTPADAAPRTGHDHRRAAQVERVAVGTQHAHAI